VAMACTVSDTIKAHRFDVGQAFDGEDVTWSRPPFDLGPIVDRRQ
jgi:hypothetical protein